MRRSIALVVTTGLLALVAGCTEERVTDGRRCAIGHGQHRRVTAGRRTGRSERQRQPESPTARPTDSPPKPTPTPSKKPDPISVQALIDKDYNGDKLKLGRVINRTDDYTTRIVTYRSEKLTVSGVMLVPDGKGPFPVLVLNHGYIDPDTYVARSGHAPRARLPGPTGLRRLPHRLPRARLRRRRPGRGLRAAAAVRGRHDQRGVRGEALEARTSWTGTGSAGWVGRWAATSP